MDLNFKRRRQERAIADEVARELLREIKPTGETPRPELLAHHIGLVFQRLNIEPDEQQMTRVLHYVSKEIARVSRSVDRQSGE